MEGAVNAVHEARLTLSLEGPARETRDIAVVVDTGFTGFLTVTPALAVELGLPFEDTARATLADASDDDTPLLRRGHPLGWPDQVCGGGCRGYSAVRLAL